MTLLKQLLRSITNTILDIRLHTMGMTDQQALDLMTREAFQEPQEAAAKLLRREALVLPADELLRRLEGWLEIRDSFRQSHPGDYSLSRLQRARAQRGRRDVAGARPSIANRRCSALSGS